MDNEIKNNLDELQGFLQKINLENNCKLLELDDSNRLVELIKELEMNHLNFSNEIQKYENMESDLDLNYEYIFMLRNKTLTLQKNYIELFYIVERMAIRSKNEYILGLCDN